MNELQISISKMGEISTNLETLKVELKEVADKYKGLVVQESDITPAKKDLAELRKLRTDIEDRRKAVKKQWNEPYTAFESEVKAALSILDEPIDEIDKQLKEFEKAEKETKRKQIEQIYADNVSDEYKPYIPLESIFKDKWLNKSYNEQSIKADMSEQAVTIRADLDAIKALNSEIEEQCLKAYKDAGNSLAAAIKRNTDYLNAKAAAEQKAREEAEKKVREEQERKEREAAQKAVEEVKEEVKAEPFPTEEPFEIEVESVDTADEWCIKIIGKDNIDKVVEYLTFAEIPYKEI